MKKEKETGGVSPCAMPSEWWSAISKTLGRPLACTERTVIADAYKSYAGSVVPPEIVAEIICPMIASADGKILQIDLRSLAIADYQAGVPDDEVEYEVVMSSLLLKGGDLHHAHSMEG